MSSNDDGIQSRRVGVGNQQLVIITQLLQMLASMRHIDEMFLWLSHIMGQRLNVDVIQFWAYQGYVTGQSSTELRAIASQNILLPLQTVNNAQVVEVVKNVLTEQSGVSPQSITNIFSSHQTELLTRYNLHYWACFSFRNNILLPPAMSNEVSPGAIPTPLAMAVSLFTPQLPHPNLLPSIKRILEQALSIANNRGLLSNVAISPFGNFTPNGAQTQPSVVNELIPHKVKDANAIQAENPFSRSIVIDNKQANQLYSTIDGKKSIAKLMPSVKLDQQEFDSALRYLLKQNHIQLHNPNGSVVDSSLFLKPV
jgi:hypothetical protein